VRTLAQARARLAVHGGLATTVVVAGIFAVATLSPGCGSGGSAGGGDASGGVCFPFSPLESDFADFTKWNHLQLKNRFALAPDGGVDTVHGEGIRDIYVNLGSPGQPPCPAAGATEFPQGTILVKVMPQTNLAALDIFAQVKQGCGVNQGGAVGWEWFDLAGPQNGSATVSILWNGYTPPTSSQYGGNPTECNVCHSLMGADNDSVITSELDIKNFPCK
jgi:hypothetical protein